MHNKSWYEQNNVNTDVDHIFEVQSANHAMILKFPFINGKSDERCNYLTKCTCDYLKSVSNLNNTDSGLNRWWKGSSVKIWRSVYQKSLNNGAIYSVEKSSLASIMRDTMKNKINKMESNDDEISWLAKSELFKYNGFITEETNRFSVLNYSENECKPIHYAPNFARNICKEMGISCNMLICFIEERGDGVAVFQDYSESLRNISKAMDLPTSC
jgi:hypothetical protein